MHLSFTCKYCDYKWEEKFNSPESMMLYRSYLSCARCRDTDIKAIEKSKSKIDTYEGSPPFVDKDETLQLVSNQDEIDEYQDGYD